MKNVFEVAIFPIPGMVTFPGTVVPLHVFEPRYRRMINESIANERMIAVCDIKNKISPAKQHQTLTDTLNSNQATYQPTTIFSAGFCDTPKQTKDGRLYVNVNMRHRLKTNAEIQTLPYRIAECSVVEDEPADLLELVHYQTEILQCLWDLFKQDTTSPDTHLDRDLWASLTPAEFSFSVFQFIRFDAELMQTVLEMTQPKQRLQRIHQVLIKSKRINT